MKITLNKLLLGYLQKKNAFSRAALDGVTGRGSLTLCGGDGFDIFRRRSKFRRCKEIAKKIDLQIFKILNIFLRGLTGEEHCIGL